MFIIMLLPCMLFANDCKHIMEKDRMEIIIQQMNNKSDDVKKLNIIKTYLQRLCINTNQMLSILEVFDTKETKEKFIIYSKKYIIDIENYNKLYTN